MKRVYQLMWALGFASLGWVLRGDASAQDTGAQDTGEAPPRRILPEPVADAIEDLPPLGTSREVVSQQLDWFCEIWTEGEGVRSQPPVLPSDCREPLHGRTKSGGEGPENDTVEIARGEL